MMSLVFYQTLSHGNARAQVGNTSSSSHLLRDIAYPTQWWGVRHVQMRAQIGEDGM